MISSPVKNLFRMRILIIKNIGCESPGLIEDILKDNKITYDIINASSRTRYPKLAEYDRFIVLGGPQSANDKTMHIQKEIGFIKKVVKSNKPYLGICLGAQLLAKALGAEIKVNKEKEIGNYIIEIAKAAKSDNLLRGILHKFNVFEWHGETFDIPKNAVKLAYGSTCSNQAFRYQKSYGIQFHLEVTPDMLKEWLNLPGYKDELKQQGVNVFKFTEEFVRNYPNYKKTCSILITNWLVS